MEMGKVVLLVFLCIIVLVAIVATCFVLVSSRAQTNVPVGNRPVGTVAPMLPRSLPSAAEQVQAAAAARPDAAVVLVSSTTPATTVEVSKVPVDGSPSLKLPNPSTRTWSGVVSDGYIATFSTTDGRTLQYGPSRATFVSVFLGADCMLKVTRAS